MEEVVAETDVSELGTVKECDSEDAALLRLLVSAVETVAVDSVDDIVISVFRLVDCGIEVESVGAGSVVEGYVVVCVAVVVVSSCCGGRTRTAE